ncbi:DUF2891 domain-containing protein [Draconibacterium sp. IB214405]|uniref:DUF2891 domain-containing protein n=1 Tax=Draconibacterium sp. IB214405 TaxID=3097352 RepID=UPI002A0B240F|nr:DUF2891 domain-containing protein [Draconibacterium sp. IB214405]MDX8339697.1 DUF2891 domain-containing protein [Draconibacterium sp. IB214405]
MKLQITLFFLFMTCLLSAQTSTLKFGEDKADYLYHFAYECIDQEYPNKTGHVLGDDSYLEPPRVMHPAFYGCFDWHSSVHGHWTLVKILTEFPDFEYRDEIIAKLKKNITEENILQEVAYFDDEHNSTYERTYGWAWLLKLDEAIREWNDPVALELQANLSPLVDLLADKFGEFLDKLIYPIRIGEHSNIAFGMSFAYDWAEKYDADLATKIEEKALEYYQNDCDCPLTWEPGGFDFLSPCLQEASIMLKVLPEKEFKQWLKTFLPKFEKHPEKYLEIAVVTDRSDGKLAHLDGLNFSRAWCLFEMGHALNNQKLIDLGDAHFNYSYEKMDSGEYAGAHWLASFAVYALIKSN